MSDAISKQVGHNPLLGTYLVWVPMLMARESHVQNALAAIGNPRIAHYWDEHSTLVHGYREPLDLGQLAWDIYMIYRPGTRWEADLPPLPQFWMHQLPGVEGKALDPAEFARQLEVELERASSRGS